MNDSIQKMKKSWAEDRRWRGIERRYTPEDVERLRGSMVPECSLARHGAEKFWRLLEANQLVSALGAMTGNQAVQQVQAGLKAIYLSGWQVAADANLAGQMYPDQSLYPSNSVPEVVRRIQGALRRADQIQHCAGGGEIDWFAPIIADAEAGFGGTLNVFELCKQLIEAGAAAIHLEDQLASAKKCGHLGGKVLVPISEFVQKLQAARLAADIMGVPTLLIARTDARSARLLTSDIDPRDQEFIQQVPRTSEGFHSISGGLAMAIGRGLAYAPHADLIWCESSSPDLDEARIFAQSIHRKFPGKWLAYNLSPSFNWRKKLGDEQIARFQSQLHRLGYRFQFVTLAGFHALNHSMFELARNFAARGMPAYAEFQAAEMESERRHGYSAATHQSFVGTGYFDEVSEVITQGTSSTLAMEHSTEAEQFRGEQQDPFDHVEEYDLADVV
jgi:isocitrate lyase